MRHAARLPRAGLLGPFRRRGVALRRCRGRGLCARLLVALAAGSLALGTVGALAPPVAAASNGIWSFTPYNPPGTEVPRSFFFYTLRPGQEIEDHVSLTNLTGEPISFHVYPSDATNTPFGGAFALELPTHRMTGVGTWVRSAIAFYTVPPHTQVTFGFLLKVPADAAPGDYAGGLVALDTQGHLSGGGPIRVNVLEAVGVRIYVRVPGALAPGIAVTGLSVRASGLGAFSWLTGERRGEVLVRLTNVGNTMFRTVRTTLSVGGIYLGSAGRFAPDVLNDLLPHSSVVLAFPWKDIPSVGLYHLSVQVRAQGLSSTLRASAAGSYWDVPWPLVVVVLVVIAGVVAVLVRRRRRRARRARFSIGRPPARVAAGVGASVSSRTTDVPGEARSVGPGTEPPGSPGGQGPIGGSGGPAGGGGA